MKKLSLILCAFILFSSHDMFLKMDTYYLPAHASVDIKLYNGTFEKSENVIARNRMADVSLIGHGARIQIDSSHWTEADDMTILSFETGEPGTWVAGLSTFPRNIELAAADFNNYLEHDGVLDMLKWRQDNNAMDEDAIEKYSKHVKAIFQVGEQNTNDWQTALGYPIEFIPINNPATLHEGESLEVELLWRGQPLPNQLVYVGSDHATHDHLDAHKRHDEAHGDHTHGFNQQYRTDASGHLSVPISSNGIWYLRTIHLDISKESGLTHESNWATLTFEIGHSHGGISHRHVHSDEHAHSHDGEDEFPTTLFLIGSVVLFAGLFFWFNRKSA